MARTPGQEPVDPETADRPLEAEALVEPDGEQRCLHQGGRGEHPFQDEIAEHSGGEGRGVEDLLLAPAELHDRSDADARRAGRRAGLAVQAEEGLVPDGRGEFQLSLRDGAGQGRPAAGAGSFPVRQRIGRADRQTETAAHALEDRFVARGVCGVEIARWGWFRHRLPPGISAADGDGASSEDLSGIEAAVRIEGVLDPAHDPHPPLAELAQQVALLGDADPVFAGDGAAHGEHLFVEFGEEGVDVGDLLAVAFVGDGRRVKVSVAGVAEGGDPDAVFLLEPFDLGEGLGEAAPGNGCVFENRGRRDAGDGREGGPPCGGELRGLLGVRGLADLVRPDLREDLPDPFRLLGDDRGVAVHLDQEERRHLAGKADGGVVLDAVDRRLVHDLEGRGDDPGGDDLGDRLAGGADVPEIGEEGPLVLRRVIRRTVTSVMIPRVPSLPTSRSRSE